MYGALSYVWGDSNRWKSVIMNGEPFPITQNVYDALKHIRSRDTLRKIWVDAICIDQTNKDERNSQVLIIGDIYSSAQQVINWLGPATSNTALGMRALAFLFGDEDITFAPPWDSHPARQPRAAFHDILKRGYFERMWVIQENALASKITLQDGNHTLTWLRGAEMHRDICRIKFAVISPSWDSAGLQDVDFRPLLEVLEQNRMITRMNMQKPCRETTILDQAFDMRYRKATDRRDMLFALRNMIPEDMKAYFVVDYTKSVDELYAEFFNEVKKEYEEEMKFVEQAENERLEKERLERERIKNSLQGSGGERGRYREIVMG